jgi:phage gp29-like protein
VSANSLSRFTGRPVANSSALAVHAARPAGVVPSGMGQILKPAAFGRWILPQLSAITPSYIQSVLRGAFGGSHIEQWQLFDLMEDTWPRLAKNLNEVKRAVLAMNWDGNLAPWTEEGEPPTDSAQEKARLVANAIWRMAPDPAADENAFEQTVYDILDAWSKGFSVLEVLWQIRNAGRLGDISAPRATVWVRPDAYAWTGDGRLGLNPNALVSDAQAQRRGYTINATTYAQPDEVMEFPEDKFLIAIHKARTGHPIAGGLLRPLAWWWCAANFSADWLMNYAQIFGLPFRWASYAGGTSDETVGKICALLENMGSAAWAAFPEGTSLELREASKGGGSTPQADLIERADKNCDLLILGQTLTSDTGGMGSGSGSLALGKVHQGVKAEIIQQAANFAASVINHQLIPAILRQNYGDDSEAPEFRPEPSDTDESGIAKMRQQVESYGVAVRAGLVTPNMADEEYFRKINKLPAMPPEVVESWQSNPTREPITIQPEGMAQPPNAQQPAPDTNAQAQSQPQEEQPEEEQPEDSPAEARAALHSDDVQPSERLLSLQQEHLAKAAAADLAFIAQRGQALLKDLNDPALDDNLRRQKLADFKAWLEKNKPALMRSPSLAEALEETTAQSLGNAIATAKSAYKPKPKKKKKA